MNVITSTGIHAEVVQLVENAKYFLLLISPYVDPWDRLTTEIKQASLREGMRVMLLVRGGEDGPKQAEKAKALMYPLVQMEQLNRLHAKIYMSESEIIVTSMNLLKSSALDSWEIALRFTKADDAKQYDEISAQALMLWSRAIHERVGDEKLRRAGGAGAAMGAAASPGARTLGGVPSPTVSAAKTTQAPGPTSSLPPRPRSAPASGKAAAPSTESTPEQQLMQKLGHLAATLQAVAGATRAAAPTDRSATTRAGRAATSTSGSCIRCGVAVPKNPEKPLCPSCYKAWAKYENPLYEEEYCHGCGKAATTSLARPLCRACYARS